MTRRGLPSCFGVITILEHQVKGSFTWTGSSTLRRTSLSKPALTALAQCNGIGLGVYMAVGVAWESTKSLRGGELSIKGSGCISQQLNAEL